MFENATQVSINPRKFTKKDKKNINRGLHNFAKKTRFNQRHHNYEYNGLEIYITVYHDNTIELTTDYFQHTFSSDPKDIGCYNKHLNWSNLQGCWNSSQKMYQFVTNNLINYDEKTAIDFIEFKKRYKPEQRILIDESVNLKN